MTRQDLRRRSRQPMLEGMESRGLLNAGGFSIPSALIHNIKINIPAIHGTITGTVTGLAPTSAGSEVVTYVAQGKANIIGDGRGSGSHTITGKVQKNHTTNDTYTDGSATLQGTTDLVSLRYSGTGHTKANGSFTATLHGTAKSIGGEHEGLSGSFTAQLSGSSRSGPFTISFTIKL